MYQKCLILGLLILISGNGNLINFTFQIYDSHHIFAQTAETNQAPEAEDQKVSVDANDKVKITLEGKDDDKDDEIEFEIVSDPSHGKLDNFDKSDGTVTYAPEDAYSGDDEFEFKVVDDKGAESDKASVDIEVKATNQAPEAEDQKVSVDANDKVKITLEGKDDDKDDEIEFEIVSDPSHGKLDNFDKSDGTVTYAPEDAYSGDDEFKFKLVDDKGEESDSADVEIEVEAVTETDQQATTTGDETDQQSAEITRDQTNGSNQQSAAATTTGDESNMKAENQTTRQSLENNETNSVEVSPLTNDMNMNNLSNQAPMALDQNEAVDKNNQLNITLNGKDDDNDPIQFAVVSNPKAATLDNFDTTKGSLTFVPETDYIGNDSFSFKVIDDKGAESNLATVSVEVKENNQTNQAPQAFDQTTDESNLTNYRYVVWSAGEEEDRYILFSRSTDGGNSFSSPLSLSGNSRSNVFNPEVSSSGSNVYVVWQGQSENGNQDIFLRKSSDHASSFTETENISNDPGGSGNPDISINGNSTHVAWEGTTPGNNFIFYTKSDDGSDFEKPQKLSGDKGISYKPEISVKDSSATDSFTFKAIDDIGAEGNVATVGINLDTNYKANQEDNGKSVSIDSGHEVDITLEATDQDKDPLEFEIVTPPSDGSLYNFDPNSGTVTYIPNENNQVDIYWHNYINGQDRVMTKNIESGDTTVDKENSDPFKASQ